MAEKAVLYLLPFILVIGMGDYYFYKLEQLGKEFSHYHFFLGNPTCSGL